MGTNKNIEEVFNKNLSEYEELPSEDLWQKIALAIPVFPNPVSISGADQLSSTASSTTSFGKLASFIASAKGFLIVGGISASFIGSYLMYQSSINNPINNEIEQSEQLKSEEELIINQEQISDNEVITKDNDQNSVAQPQIIPKTNKTQSVVNNEVEEDNNLPITEKDLQKNSVQIITETAKQDEEIETAKPSKPESFYEKKVRLMKDSTRSVFEPE